MTIRKWILSVFIISLNLLPMSGLTSYAHAEDNIATESTKQDSHENETVWICSMHPQIQLPEFGQCPICFMDLIEVEKAVDDGSNNSLRQISFDERARKLAQVEVVPAVYGTVDSSVRMVGKVAYDETRVGVITAWMNGRIDKLFVDYTGSVVKKGQPMAKIYSPELLTAQAELIQSSTSLKKMNKSASVMVKSAAKRTERAAREKLRLLGLTEKQVNKLVDQGQPSDHVTLFAPLSGIVIKKSVNTGMYVKTGNRIFTIADLEKLWVVLEAYESDLHAIGLGQQVDFLVEAFPGQTFKGKVVYIDPLVNDKTRTVGVRLNVDNSDGKLKPGMFVRANAKLQNNGNGKGKPLLIPDTAPLFTGKRALVYVQNPEKEGEYEGREVILGARRGRHYQVKSGLEEGEQVVSQGNFKIDSAIQIQARPSMMNPFMGKKVSDTKEIKPLFISRLNLLNKAYRKVNSALKYQSMSDFSEGLESLYGIMKEMDFEDLEGDARLAWKELSMLLSSDIVLLREAEDAPDRARMFAEMSGHFQQVREMFNLPDIPVGKPGSEKLRNVLGTLVDSYIAFQEALAADALAKAVKGKPLLVQAINDAVPELNNSGIRGSRELAGELLNTVPALEAGTDLEKIRIAFYPLSKAVTKAVAGFGVNNSTPVYEQYCSMAFDNTGATWLAATKEIFNPYFGDLMLHCGEIRRQLKDK